MLRPLEWAAINAVSRLSLSQQTGAFLKNAFTVGLFWTLLITGCGKTDTGLKGGEGGPTAASKPAAGPANATKKDPDGVHNLQQVSNRIYSGSEPHGEEGFASLEKLGVKTVVSVDGAKPDIELARRHGLRYVHIPIGYDGVPKEAGESLARVVREAESPVYVHCHHGKHRGPAAAAVACVAAGNMNGKEALQILVRAGTSKDYAGLRRNVEAYAPPPRDAKLPELVEIAQVDSLASAMASVDRAFDNLKLLRETKWVVPLDHPDLVPVQEALQLQEGFHEAARTLGSENDEQMKTWLAASEKLATELRTALDANDVNAATEKSKLLEQSCKQCHTKYRDR